MTKNMKEVTIQLSPMEVVLIRRTNWLRTINESIQIIELLRPKSPIEGRSSLDDTLADLESMRNKIEKIRIKLLVGLDLL
jgi:hypothetical protein